MPTNQKDFDSHLGIPGGEDWFELPKSQSVHHHTTRTTQFQTINVGGRIGGVEIRIPSSSPIPQQPRAIPPQPVNQEVPTQSGKKEGSIPKEEENKQVIKAPDGRKRETKLPEELVAPKSDGNHNPEDSINIIKQIIYFYYQQNLSKEKQSEIIDQTPSLRPESLIFAFLLQGNNNDLKGLIKTAQKINPYCSCLNLEQLTEQLTEKFEGKLNSR